MKSLKIAASHDVVALLSTHREVVTLADTDFTDVAAVVISIADSRSGILALLKRTGFNLPVFIFSESIVEALPEVTGVISGKAQDYLELETAASDYEEDLLPPFFNTLSKYVAMDNSTFACPGHQHGEFFKKHPAGRQFFDFFGENVFRADMCNADVKLGDLLIHEGSAKHAQKFAAKVFHADKTYFVLNGTSGANKVVTNALLTRGDLVLFDRNNHKSNHHGALIQAGATPVYLEASRNPFGFIGG
ncbi:Orn/Lys/Arg decarboxylase N-terminal domain-containing protein, partial [Cedecea davisae]